MSIFTQIRSIYAAEHEGYSGFLPEEVKGNLRVLLTGLWKVFVRLTTIPQGAQLAQRLTDFIKDQVSLRKTTPELSPPSVNAYL